MYKVLLKLLIYPNLRNFKPKYNNHNNGIINTLKTRWENNNIPLITVIKKSIYSNALRLKKLLNYYSSKFIIYMEQNDKIKETAQKPDNKQKEKAPKTGGGKNKEKGDSKKGNKTSVKVPKGTRDFTPFQMSIRAKAFDTITGVFRKHGAVEIDTPVFELKETLTGKYGEESKLIYELNDQGGELLALRYDLTVPFARYMALSSLPSIKRYHIGKVYRRDDPIMTKGRFREFYQCDFDIAGTNYGKMIPDAEVLKVVVEILNGLEIGQFEIKLNHRKLLDAMIEVAKIPEDKFKQVCSSVDKLDKEPWVTVKQELISKGLEEDQCEKLWSFCQLNNEPWKLFEILASNEELLNNSKGKEALEDMKILFEYLDILKINCFMRFDLSLARGLDYYTGLIYEGMLLSNEHKVGSICGGGRYDELLGMFSGKPLPAVGVSIGIERVLSILEEKYKVNNYII